MSEHEKHTGFLRQCICYDESVRRQELHERITRIQRDMRCVRRAVWLMAILVALILAGVGYGVLLVDNFPYNMPQFMINLGFWLGLGSLISLLAFIFLGMFHRWKLNQQREECRQRVAKLLELRLGKPVGMPSPDTGTIESAGRILGTSVN